MERQLAAILNISLPQLVYFVIMNLHLSMNLNLKQLAVDFISVILDHFGYFFITFDDKFAFFNQFEFDEIGI